MVVLYFQASAKKNKKRDARVPGDPGEEVRDQMSKVRKKAPT
jgi:hypothetical protein